MLPVSLLLSCRCVLIAPLWNWNVGGIAASRIVGSSNRTFMELKSEGKALTDLYIFVLIAPLWNWNSYNATVCRFGHRSNRTFMELKSKITSLLSSATSSSNRTFMELKCLNTIGSPNFRSVLIAPLWNWYDGTFEMPDGKTSSNRTFMELKCRTSSRWATRTSWF